ncbi:presequence protease, mitochondrial-like isoform X10 [Chlorocebus sabaeus]|uniref:presequence protease, mitochondrial-like isoform X8 n=1 Tax=Chlorocebus sabaeus TaxID=60711 RepID=UPI003BFA1FD3
MWANASELSPTRTQILPGMDHFLYGLSDEMKQAHREQLFTISHKKLLAMSDRYLGTGKSTHGLAILRPENPKIAKDPSWIISSCRLAGRLQKSRLRYSCEALGKSVSTTITSQDAAHFRVAHRPPLPMPGRH